jgi:putative ABC transport system permease protein
MMLLQLAWRNLLRNQRRSLMTLLAMILGLSAILLFGGYIRDINYSLQTNFVTSSGHLQIQDKDFFHLGSGDPAAYGIPNYAPIIQAIRADEVLAPMLAVVTPNLQFGAIAGNYAANVSRTVYVVGTVVDDQNQMRKWNDYGQIDLSSRNLSMSGTPADSAIIGTGVARVLRLCEALKVSNCSSESPVQKSAPTGQLSDDIAALAASVQPSTRQASKGGLARLEILAANARGAPNVAGVNVLAAEFQGVKEFDDVYLALHLSHAQRLVFGAAPPQVTAIMIQLRHTAQIPLARERLLSLIQANPSLARLAVLDYEELNPFYGQTLAMFGAIFGFVSVLMGAIVLFTVSNTMGTAVVERTSEIGTLRAIGLRRMGVRTMFVTEGLMLGLIGAVLGVIVSIALAWLINRLGLTWTPPGRSEAVPLAVRLVGEYQMILGSALGIIAVAAVSAAMPATRAARMNIVEALRHV